MNKKAAIELSMTFIVSLIIGIIIFSLAIVFALDLFEKAQEVQKIGLPDSFDIEAENCVNRGDKLCVPINKKTIASNRPGSFGIIINNIYGSEKEFMIYTSFSTGQLENGNIVNPDEIDVSDWTLPVIGPILLENNDYRIEEVPFIVPKGTKQGVYVFNSNVCFNADDDPQLSKCSFQHPSLYNPTVQFTITVS